MDFLGMMQEGHNQTFTIPERTARDYMVMIKSEHDVMPNLYCKVNACSVGEVVMRVEVYVRQMSAFMHQQFGVDILKGLFKDQQDGNLAPKLSDTYANMSDYVEIVNHMAEGLTDSMQEIHHRLHTGGNIEKEELDMISHYDITNILVYEIDKVDMFTPTSDDEQAIVNLISQSMKQKEGTKDEEE